MGVSFFRKNLFDLSNKGASVLVTDAVAIDDGAAFLNLLRNRNNTSGWSTTGSTDAANTTLNVDLGSQYDIDFIALVKHNFKSYTIEYFDEALEIWRNLTPVIAVTNNTEETTFHTFTKLSIRRFRLIITGTFVADEDKFLRQLIFTTKYGEMVVEPIIVPAFDKNKNTTKYLSGKRHIRTSPVSFACRIAMNNVVEESDLLLVEELFDYSYEGFLLWICGGTIDQYPSLRYGYRLEDFFLVNLENEYSTEWEDSRYANGMGFDLRMSEIV